MTARRLVQAVVVFLGVLAAMPARAQSANSIGGTVVDEAGGVVPGAVVTVTTPGGQSRRIDTDASGAFTLGDLPPGRSVVTAGMSGFDDAVTTVQVEPGVGVSGVRLVLRTAGLREEVVVTATRTATETSTLPAAVSVVSSRVIESRNVNRISDALTQVPGLFLGAPANGQVYAGTGAGGFSLRGLNQQRTLVLLDGQPLQDASGGNTNFRIAFMPEVSRIEVVPGAFSSLYGSSAIGGVINIITKQPDRRSATGSVKKGFGDAAATSENLYYQERLGRLGLAGGAGYDDHRSYITEFVTRSPVAGAPGTLVTGATATTTREGVPAFIVGDKNRSPWKEQHATVRATFAATPTTRLTGGFGYSDSKTSYTRFNTYLRDANGQPVSSGTLGIDGQRVTLAESNFVTAAPLGESSRRGYGSLDTLVSSRVPVSVSLARITRGLTNVSVAATSTWNAGPGTHSDSPNSNTDGSVVATWPVLKGLVTGFSVHRDHLERRTYTLASWRDTSTRTGVSNGASGGARTTSAFGQQQLALGAGTTVYLGARVDRWSTEGTYFQNTAPATTIAYPERSVTSFSPKVSLVSLPVPALTLRASFGRSFRAPTNIDLYSTTVIPASQSSTGFLTTQADPTMTPERGTGAEVGVEWRVTRRHKLTATYYDTHLTDLIYTKNVTNALTQRINAGAAVVRGVEVSGEARVTQWATLSAHASRIGSEITENEADPLSVGKRLTTSPRALAGLDLLTQAGRWTGVLTLSHVGQAFVLAQNTDVLQGVPGSTDAYTVMNGKVGYRVVRALTASVAANNLTDRVYNQFYRMPGRNATVELTVSF